MKLIQLFLVGATLLLSMVANAEVKLEDNSLIKGKWTLYAEAIDRHKEQVALFGVWDFRDNGVLNTVTSDRYGRTKNLEINLTYKIEEGVLKKQRAPGRSKMEACKAIELDNKHLILKCTFVHLFFKR
jgi:hypothetical protein